MTNSKTPICFIATSDPSAMEPFYRDTLGLNHIETTPFAVVFDDNGVMLRVQIVPDFLAAPHTVHGWSVSDIDRQIANLVTKGVEMLIFAGMGQSATGVWETPSGDQIAWFKDPSGNILSLTQYM